MQKTSTLFAAGVIAAMTLAPASASAQQSLHKVPAEIQQKMATMKASREDLARQQARQAAAMPFLKSPKSLAKATPASPFQTALTRVPFMGRPAAAAANVPVSFSAMASTPVSMMAYVNYSATYTSGSFYNISMPDGTFTEIGASDYAPSCGGALVGDHYYSFMVDDTYSWIGWYFYYLLDFDAETGELLNYSDLDDGTYSFYCVSFTASPDEDKAFGLFLNADASGYEFATIDYATGARTAIASTSTYFYALAGGKDCIYGFALDNNLYKINYYTGEETLVGPTGVAAADEEGVYGQSATVDTKTGTIYWAEVDATGEGSALYTVDPATGAATKALDYGLNQIYGLAIGAPAAEDDAPAVAADLALNFEAPATTGTISFTAPATTFAGAELAGELTYSVMVNGQEVATAACQAGAAVSVPVTVEEGTINVVVTTANAVGTSPKAKASTYVGYDTPVAPENVAFAFNEGVATVTWDAVTTGIHEGYIGTPAYEVIRIAGQDTTVVAAAQAETSFTETLEVGQLANYVYGITAIADGRLESATSLSNGVVIGNAMDVPVYIDFANEDNMNLMTIIDANGDGTTWNWTSTYSCARYNYNSSNKADDWFISPDINLKGGRTYVLTYHAWAASDYFPELLEVTVGAGATADAQTQVIVAEYTVAASTDDVEVEFQVPADGKYNIGFHCVSDADEFMLYLQGFSLEAGPLGEAPAAAAVEAVAGAEGALEATINITLPTKTVAGDALQSISKVTVARNGELVDTLEEALTPGEQIFYVDDEVPAIGTYTWTVVCYNEYDNGQKATCSAFIGDDVPAAPANITLADQTTTVRLDWEPVTTGANGGYVNADSIVYEVYSINDGYVGDLLITTAECTATVDYDTNVGSQTLLQYAVRATGKGGNSSYAGSSAIVVGEPYALPFIEDFAGGTVQSLFWTSKSSSDFYVSLDGTEGDGSAYFRSYADEAWGNLSTGKINIAGAINPEVIFDYKGIAGREIKLEVEIVNQAGEAEVITTVTNNDAADWTPVAVQIPAKYVAEPYIMVTFHASVEQACSDEALEAIYIDNVQVRDVLEYNASVKLSCPASVVKGENIIVVATVTNEGANEYAPVKVVLTAGDTEITKTYEAPLASFASMDVPFTVESSIFDEEESMDVQVEVVYDLDLKPEDNVASATVELKNSTAATVENLAAAVTEEGVTLTWDAPSVSVAERTESWEDYDHETAFPYTAANSDGTIPADWNQEGTLGDWTAYDLDGGGVYTWSSSSITFNLAGDAMGFAVIDPTQLSSSIDVEAWVHSGEKCLLCMNSVPSTCNQGLCNNDWLISPELPGCAQTVSFFVTEITDSYGAETFEFYFSFTDKDVDSFIKFGEGECTSSWQQFTYNLPEGATYFAIRVTSNDIFGWIMDDITFTAGAAAPVSFNVYCDGEFVANVTEPTYTDVNGAAEGHTYAVTAVYANGQESAPVIISTDPVVGIETIAAETADAPAYNAAGIRVDAKAAKGVILMDGRKVVK